MVAPSRLPGAARPWAIPALAVLLVGAHLWRATRGVDLGDGSHAVELAMRLARGDRPFADEMNAQVLGAWPAAPFTRLWLELVGLDGIVLASRVFFVAWTGACAYVAWRALAPLLGPAVAAGAIAVATVPAAYNLQVVSYNTTPALMLLVATAAAVPARARSGLGWAAVAGAAAVLAAVSHPVVAPAAVVLVLVCVVVGPHRARAGLLVGAGATAALLLAVAVAVWGLDAVAETLAYTREYQGLRPPLADRLAFSAGWFARDAWGLTYVAALALGVVAALLRPGAPRVAALLLAVGLTTWRGLERATDSPSISTWSWTSPVLGLALVLVLLPQALPVLRTRPRSPLAHLLVVGAATTAVGVPVVTAFTSSSPAWGAFAAVLPPALLAVTATALAGARTYGRAAAVVVTLSLVGGLGLAHAGTPYRQDPAWSLDERITGGAFAGLVTAERWPRPTDPDSVVESIGHSSAAVEACGTAGDGLLSYGYPSAHLLADRSFDTPIVWLGRFGAANARALDRITASGRVPECVVVARAMWQQRDDIARTDPLLAWVLERYELVAWSNAVVVLGRADTGGTPAPEHGHLG